VIAFDERRDRQGFGREEGGAAPRKGRADAPLPVIPPKQLCRLEPRSAPGPAASRVCPIDQRVQACACSATRPWLALRAIHHQAQEPRYLHLRRDRPLARLGRDAVRNDRIGRGAVSGLLLGADQSPASAFPFRRRRCIGEPVVRGGCRGPPGWLCVTARRRGGIAPSQQKPPSCRIFRPVRACFVRSVFAATEAASERRYASFRVRAASEQILSEISAPPSYLSSPKPDRARYASFGRVRQALPRRRADVMALRRAV